MARNDDPTKRTSSYNGDKAYDRMLSECDVSSLRFLSNKYSTDLYDYKMTHNLDSIDEWRQYKDLQLKKKMIDEELSIRIMNDSASLNINTIEFDSTTNTIYDPENYKTYNAAFNELENGMIVYDDEYETCETVATFFNEDKKKKENGNSNG